MSNRPPSDPEATAGERTKRTRRAVPITKRTTRAGQVSYTFQIDAGIQAGRLPRTPPLHLPDAGRGQARAPASLDRGGRGHAGPARQGDRGRLFDRVARRPPGASQLARRLPVSPPAGYRPPRHSAVTASRHPAPRRAGDLAPDWRTNSPARQARTPFRRGAGLPARSARRRRVFRAADHVRRARHQST